MTIRICAFDAYGTLFDVNAAARKAASRPGREELAALWPELAADWRTRQLEYTWLRSLAGNHADFWQITSDALDWALEASGLDGAEGLREELLELYWKLEAFPEVPGVLDALGKAGIPSAILSNGSPEMLDGAVRSAGLSELLDDVLSVESVGVFKPHPSVYALVTKRYSCAPEEVLFVSSNGWDAAAAAGFGFRSVWVNRAGAPLERLPWKPARILDDLKDVPALAEAQR